MPAVAEIGRPLENASVSPLVASGANPQGATRGPGSVRLARGYVRRQRSTASSFGDGAASASKARFLDDRSKLIYDALTNPDGVDLGHSPDTGLRALVWRGVTHAPLRPFAWRVLLQYPQSASAPLHSRALQRRLLEYRSYITTYFDPRGSSSGNERLPQEEAILLQISKDMPRHTAAAYHSTRLRTRLERVLFIWSVRHPATSYVQGFDDFVLVFFSVFLTECLTTALMLIRGRSQGSGGDAGQCDSEPYSLAESIAAVNSVSLWEQASSLVHGSFGIEGGAALDAALSSLDVDPAALDRVETDTYFCAGVVLEWVQHHYLHGMPGIHAVMRSVETIVGVVDPEYLAFVRGAGVALPSFLYSWIHCFLVRLLPDALVPRLFDTFIAIGEGFASFLPYLCAALFLSTKSRLHGKPMETLQQVLQRPTLLRGSGHRNSSHDDNDALRQVPSSAWLETLVAEAYLLQLKHPSL